MDGYWARAHRRRISRQNLLRGSVAAAGGLGALALVGCGDDDSGGKTATPASTGSPAASATTGTAGSPTSGTSQASGAPFKPANGKRGGVLTYLTTSEPPNLDPHLVITVQMLQTTQMYARLMHFDAKVDKLVPELALSYETPDSTTIRYKLRSGVKFHGGEVLTSEDVKYSLERIGQIGQAKPDPQFAQAFMMSDVNSIEAPDANTVVIKLKQPSAPTLSYLSAPFNGIVNKKFTEANDLKTKANGTGPFKLKSWQRSNRISFERHADYFWASDGLPFLDGWQAIISPDAGTNNAAFVSGQTLGAFPNTFSGKAKQLASFKKDIPDLQSVGKDVTYWSYFDMNKRKPGWSDPKVRKAVQLTINRQTAAERVLDGEYSQQGPIAAGFPFYPLSQDEINQMPGFRKDKTQDIADAKKLMEAAGFSSSNPLKATGITTPLHPFYEPFLLAIKEDLKQIGIEIEVKEFPDFGSFLQARVQLNFDVYAYSQGGPDDVDQYLTEVFHSKSASNFGGFNDAKTDDLLAKQRAALVRDERKKIVDELQRYLMTEAHPHGFLPTQHGYAWWRKPYQVDSALTSPSYSGFFGQFTWLDPVPGNMKNFDSF
ncbi:MAG: ABC transporter substrate-binding protein [Dehalococcoidia bacterium]|nr:ABC transporter substrate-binding protein [Dehalococcoidia bacterium]